MAKAIGSQPRREISIEGSVKDTIESILVAFMLAFIFRAFIVEAFVIPTGSMAPTLLGAHMRFRCPDCGYRFDLNYASADRGDDIEIPSEAGVGQTLPAVCPNCGFVLQRDNFSDPAANPTNPPVHYGDRILVLKYLYLLQEPKRWDVVVFKAPVDPKRFDYSQNYIKRLIGKPGESIMVLDGDVYVGTGESLASFKVQTKPRYAQDALWRIVYDNDYYSRGVARTDLRGAPAQPFEQPWKIGATGQGWSLGDGSIGHRDFKFDSSTAAGTVSFDPQANPTAFSFTDSLAYDITEPQLDTSYSGGNNVSDVKLSLTYQRSSGTGPLRLELTKLNHTFEAQLNPSDVTLLMDGQPLGSAALPGGSTPIKIDFQNVDYRAAVLLNGKEVLATTPQNYAPDVSALMDAFRFNRELPKPRVDIVADHQTCTLAHVSLWRDVYYLNRISNANNKHWASPADFPENLTHLGKDEFFVLGDNSAVSFDARYWSDPINIPSEGLSVQSGRVPRRFLLGKAFFVYWPAGYRPLNGLPSIAPNFGDMRFIQ